MESLKSENESELTSTEGNIMSTLTKEEKNDTNDATPTSSTDASTASTASKIISDDPISSTSSDTLEKSSSMSSVDVDKVTSVDHVADLLEINVGNVKITEDVEDLVHDLESLLGESTDSFVITRNVEETKPVADDAIPETNIKVNEMAVLTKDSSSAEIKELQESIEKPIPKAIIENSTETSNECETTDTEGLKLDEISQPSTVTAEILSSDKKVDNEEKQSTVQCTKQTEFSVQSSKDTPENEVIAEAAQIEDEEIVTEICRTVSVDDSLKTESTETKDDEIVRDLSLVEEAKSLPFTKDPMALSKVTSDEETCEQSTFKNVIKEHSLHSTLINETLELEANAQNVNKDSEITISDAQNEISSAMNQEIDEPVVMEKTPAERKCDIQTSANNSTKEIVQETSVEIKMDSPNQELKTKTEIQQIVEESSVVIQSSSDIEETNSTYIAKDIVENVCEVENQAALKMTETGDNETLEISGQNIDILPEEPDSSKGIETDKHANLTKEQSIDVTGKVEESIDCSAGTEDNISYIPEKISALSTENSPSAQSNDHIAESVDLVNTVPILDDIKDSSSSVTCLSENIRSDSEISKTGAEQVDDVSSQEDLEKSIKNKSDCHSENKDNTITPPMIEELNSMKQKSSVELVDTYVSPKDIKEDLKLEENVIPMPPQKGLDDKGIPSNEVGLKNALEESIDIVNASATLNVIEERKPIEDFSSEQKMLTEPIDIPRIDAGLGADSTEQEHKSEQVEVAVVYVNDELHDKLDVKSPLEKVSTSGNASIDADSVVECIQMDSIVSDIAEVIEEKISTEEQVSPMQKSLIEKSEILPLDLKADTTDHLIEDLKSLPVPTQNKEISIITANSEVETVREKHTVEVIMEETKSKKAYTEEVPSKIEQVDVNDTMNPDSEEAKKEPAIIEIVSSKIGDDIVTDELPGRDEQPEQVVDVNEAMIKLTSEESTGVPEIIENADPEIEKDESVSVELPENEDDISAEQKCLNINKVDIASTDMVTLDIPLVDTSSDHSSLSTEKVIRDLVSVESKDTIITMKKQLKVSALEFAPLVLSEDDSDDDSVPTLALDPDEQNVPSEVVSTGIEDENIDPELLPSIDESLVMKPTFDELPTSSIDVQENLETILAVAALQKIDIPKEPEPESLLSDNERREMEALQRAVESITDLSDSPYVEDVNDLLSESAIVYPEPELMEGVVDENVYDLEESSAQHCSPIVEDSTSQCDIPAKIQTSDVEPSTAVTKNIIEIEQDIQELSVPKNNDEVGQCADVQEDTQTSIKKCEIDTKFSDASVLDKSESTERYSNISKKETIIASTEKETISPLENHTVKEIHDADGVQEKKAIIEKPVEEEIVLKEAIVRKVEESEVPTKESLVVQDTSSIAVERVTGEASIEVKRELLSTEVSEQDTLVEQSSSLIAEENIDSKKSEQDTSSMADEVVTVEKEEADSRKVEDIQPPNYEITEKETSIKATTSLIVEEVTSEKEADIEEIQSKRSDSGVREQKSSTEYNALIVEKVVTEEEEVNTEIVENKQLKSEVSKQEISVEKNTSLIVEEQGTLRTVAEVRIEREITKRITESEVSQQKDLCKEGTSLIVEEVITGEATTGEERNADVEKIQNKESSKSGVTEQEPPGEHVTSLVVEEKNATGKEIIVDKDKDEKIAEQGASKIAEQCTSFIVEEVTTGGETVNIEKAKGKRSKVPEQETSIDSSGIISETVEIQPAREKDAKAKANERPRRHKKVDNKLEQLSINVDVPDGERTYSPKISIKPIRAPDDEVSTTSNSDSDIVKGSLKMTITKQSDKLHSVLKVVDTDNQDIHPTEHEEPIPKLIIKSKMQQVEPQHSPKMSTRSSRQSYSPTTSSQRSLSPRITIKPVMKPENIEPLSPLKIKIGLKPDESSKKKVSIKPAMKSDDAEPRVEQSPRITIKPIPKPEVELIPRLNIKALKKQEEESEERERSSPKITIKPIIKPQEESLPTEEEDPVKERIVLKINKGNLPTPSKDAKKREHPPEDEKSEKLAKITVKFSKEGGHPHIVQQVEELSKRPHEEQGLQEKSKKQKIEVESIISTRSKHKEHVQAEGTDAKSRLKDTDNSYKHKDAPHEYQIEAKRAKKDDNPARSRRSSSRTRQKEVDNSDEIQIIEPKLNSPIVISEDSRSQDSSVIVLDDFKEDSASDISLSGINLDLSKGTPGRSDSILSANSAMAVTPSPRKRGRPRKVPVGVRDEFKEQEEPPKAKPMEDTVATPATPQVHESGRPKRSCVGQSVCDTLGIKPRKPRGPGRGRGGKRGMGNRPLSNKESTAGNTLLNFQQEFESHQSKNYLQVETGVKKDEDTIGTKDLTILIDDSDDVILVVEPDLEAKATPPTRGGKRKYKSRGKRRSLDVSNREVLASTSNILVRLPQTINPIHGRVFQKSAVIENAPDKAVDSSVSLGKPSELNPIDNLKSSTSSDDKDDSVTVSSTVDEETSIRDPSEIESGGLQEVIDKNTLAALDEPLLPGGENNMREGNHEHIEGTSVKVDSSDIKGDLPYSVSSQAESDTSEIFSSVGSSVVPHQGMPASILPLLDTSEKASNPELTLVTSSTLPSEVMMVDEDTRMSADTSSRAQTPAKQMVAPSEMVVEESQSSVHSNGTESGKTPSCRPSKAARLEVQEPENVVVTADLLTEYHWNGNGPFMIQEQVAQFLGIKSFKRKYPNIPRRVLDMQERDHLRENGLVSENMCDLGLTSVNSADILDIMYSDFQEKYEEYCKHLRDKQAKELITKQRALSLAASHEKNKADILKQAVQSAALWNARFNKNRKDERKACMDLQTLTVHFPKGRMKQFKKPSIGHYPVAVVPGQFTDYYEDFTPTEINNLPLNTMCYDDVNFIPRDDSEDSGSESSDSDSGSSGSSSSGSDSDSSSGIEDCKLCKHTPSKKATVK